MIFACLARGPIPHRLPLVSDLRAMTGWPARMSRLSAKGVGACFQRAFSLLGHFLPNGVLAFFSAHFCGSSDSGHVPVTANIAGRL